MTDVNFFSPSQLSKAKYLARHRGGKNARWIYTYHRNKPANPKRTEAARNWIFQNMPFLNDEVAQMSDERVVALANTLKRLQSGRYAA